MQRYIEPLQSEWTEITSRPQLDQGDLSAAVSEILIAVCERGDQALLEFGKKFDCPSLSSLRVGAEEILAAEKELSQKLKDAIAVAYSNIKTFHKEQISAPQEVETMPGVKCWRKSIPIEKVGLYIPGGTAPLFSSVLMMGIPARIAGCREIVLCTPPRADGSIDPSILYCANLVGISKIFKVGGAQAIAAMAYGTESVPQVSKVFGPGNQYVTAAKQMVSLDAVAIDMPAGPSEVAVYADETAVPAFVASDLLSQAEHGPDSQVLLVASSEEIIDAVESEVRRQLEVLPRKDVAEKSLANSTLVVLEDRSKAIALLNQYAAEHLILASKNTSDLVDKVQNAGSVFIGNYTPEAAGDYASGTNHVLPTNRAATAYSGVSLDSFYKKVTFQEITAQGLLNISSTVETMAEAEQLLAHSRAVGIRREALQEKAVNLSDNESGLRLSINSEANTVFVSEGSDSGDAQFSAEQLSDILSSLKSRQARKAVVQRDTNETKIRVAVNLDGSGKATINTGLGFFDHMLEQIARHALIDLDIQVAGDLQVDEHHTIEDTGIALGEAFDIALGDKVGLTRYGFLLPMDESLAQVAIDFSGRNWLVWDAPFKREKVGDVPTEMIPHFFKSFCDAAKCNLNIKTEGENEHHMIEGIFKAFARALRMALARDERQKGIPSTKGVL